MSSSQRAGLPHSPSARQVHFREHLLPHHPAGRPRGHRRECPDVAAQPDHTSVLAQRRIVADSSGPRVPRAAASSPIRRSHSVGQTDSDGAADEWTVAGYVEEDGIDGDAHLMRCRSAILVAAGHQLSATGQIVALTAGVSCLEPLHPGHPARPYKAVGCNCYIALSSTTTFRRDLSSSSYADPLHAINRVPVIAAPTGPTNRRRASIESSSDLTKCLCQRDLATIDREWW